MLGKIVGGVTNTLFGGGGGSGGGLMSAFKRAAGKGGSGGKGGMSGALSKVASKVVAKRGGTKTKSGGAIRKAVTKLRKKPKSAVAEMMGSAMEGGGRRKKYGIGGGR